MSHQGKTPDNKDRKHHFIVLWHLQVCMQRVPGNLINPPPRSLALRLLNQRGKSMNRI